MSSPAPSPITQFFDTQGERLTLKSHTFLWKSGEAVKTLYLVQTGLLRLFNVRKDGTTTTLLGVGAGGLVGTHPLLGVVEASAGAEALLPSQVSSLPVDAYRAWLDSATNGTADSATLEDLQAWLFSDLRRHLADTYARLELAHASASERLARVLLSLNALGLLASARRRQLAELANLTVETTVRTLRTWEDEGVLSSRRLGTLSAPERDALAALLYNDNLTLPYS